MKNKLSKQSNIRWFLLVCILIQIQSCKGVEVNEAQKIYGYNNYWKFFSSDYWSMYANYDTEVAYRTIYSAGPSLTDNNVALEEYGFRTFSHMNITLGVEIL